VESLDDETYKSCQSWQEQKKLNVTYCTLMDVLTTHREDRPIGFRRTKCCAVFVVAASSISVMLLSLPPQRAVHHRTPDHSDWNWGSKFINRREHAFSTRAVWQCLVSVLKHTAFTFSLDSWAPTDRDSDFLCWTCWAMGSCACVGHSKYYYCVAYLLFATSFWTVKKSLKLDESGENRPNAPH
jgi:hypothetical protein